MRKLVPSNNPSLPPSLMFYNDLSVGPPSPSHDSHTTTTTYDHQSESQVVDLIHNPKQDKNPILCPLFNPSPVIKFLNGITKPTDLTLRVDPISIKG